MPWKRKTGCVISKYGEQLPNILYSRYPTWGNAYSVNSLMDLHLHLMATEFFSFFFPFSFPSFWIASAKLEHNQLRGRSGLIVHSVTTRYSTPWGFMHGSIVGFCGAEHRESKWKCRELHQGYRANQSTLKRSTGRVQFILLVHTYVSMVDLLLGIYLY